MFRFATFVILLITGLHLIAEAQELIPLKQKLNQLAEQSSVSFSYDDELVSKLKALSSEDKTLEEELKSITQQTGLWFTLTSEGVILITKHKHNFCAIVTDIETKLPIHGAQVLINSIPQVLITDSEGKITFSSRNTFQDSISFQHIAYNSPVIAMGLLNNNCAEIYMIFEEMTLNEVVITDYISKGINASKKDHSLTIKPDELALLPGETDGDVLLAIKTLPGITSPNGKAGNLHFRGSTTDQTLITYDEMPIYHKGHYYGAISPYNPKMIEEINVYRSGYTAELGGRVGGAIELNSGRKIPDSTEVGIGINSLYSAADVRVPISDKISVSGAIRSSYPESWKSPKLKAINEMVFTPSSQSLAEEDPTIRVEEDLFKFRDINAGMLYTMPNGQLKFSYLNIYNENNFVFSNPNTGTNELKYELKNTGQTLNWLQYWNQKLSSDISFTYAHYDYFSSRINYPINQPPRIVNEFNNEVSDVKLKALFFINRENEAITFGYEGSKMATKDFNITGGTVNDQTVGFYQESYLHAVFANYENKLFDKFQMNAGIRASLYTKTADTRLEPRLTASYQATPSMLIKSSAGLYSQFINQNIFFDFEDTRAENLIWFLVNEERPLIKSEQLMLGTVLTYEDLIIDIEGYFKHVDNLTTESDRPITPFISGELNVIGADILIRKQFNKLDTWLSYSYLNSNMYFPDINQNDFPTYYDQPHTLNVTSTLPVKNWQFSLGWYISSGAPNYLYSNFFPEPGRNPPDPNDPISQDLNEGRFPAMHQLDMAAVYNIPTHGKGWKASVGISILNIYDQKNLIEEAYFNIGTNTIQAKRYNIGFAPNIMFNIGF